MDSFWFLSTICFSSSQFKKSTLYLYYVYIRGWYIYKWHQSFFSSFMLIRRHIGIILLFWDCLQQQKPYTKRRFPLRCHLKTIFLISERIVNFMTFHLPFCCSDQFTNVLVLKVGTLLCLVIFTGWHTLENDCSWESNGNLFLTIKLWTFACYL